VPHEDGWRSRGGERSNTLEVVLAGSPDRRLVSSTSCCRCPGGAASLPPRGSGHVPPGLDPGRRDQRSATALVPRDDAPARATASPTCEAVPRQDDGVGGPRAVRGERSGGKRTNAAAMEEWATCLDVGDNEKRARLEERRDFHRPGGDLCTEQDVSTYH